MPYVPASAAGTGDPISLTDEKAGALRMSVDLADFGSASTSAIDMFARRDAFRTVAEAIADGMSTVPFDLYERDEKNGRRKIYDHPVAAALDEPMPGTSQYRWIESLVLDDVLHDRWAVLVLREDDGSVQLVRLPAKWISFGVDAFRRVVSVELNRPGVDPYSIPISECIFDVGYDPNPSGKSTKGYSISRTLESAATELDLGAAYRAKLLAGGPKVPMYVARPMAAPDWIKNGGRDRFKEDFAGYSAEKAGMVPVLDDGMELKAAPQLLQDTVQYKETRLAAQIEFAIAMHYPPELIGYRGGNNSNIAALREQLYVDVLGGRIIAFRQALNIGLYRTKLLERRFYVEENVGVRLIGNPELQAKILQTQVGAPIRTVNEARKLLNQPPVPGGDELIVPLNVVKGGLASPTDTAPKTLGRGHAPRALPAGAKGATPAVYVDRLDKMIDRFAGDLSKALRAQADRVTKALGDGNAPGSIGDAFDTATENAELAATILPHALAIAEAGAEVVLDAYNPERDGFESDKMLPWLVKASQGEAAAVNAGTFATLAQNVTEPDWADAVAATFASRTAAGARLWARSIATTAESFGGQDAAKASGLTHKRWIERSSKSARHAALHGETVRIDEVFSNGMRWPGDPAGGTANTAECSCRAEYLVLSD